MVGILVTQSWWEGSLDGGASDDLAVVAEELLSRRMALPAVGIVELDCTD